MINEKIAQSIVLKTMSVIGFDVNIMDENAYIIASANKNRIGDFHLIADKVIKSGDSLSIGGEKASILDGVKEGVTFPIKFYNRIIGAVGITGDPDLVTGYGELLRYTTELMVEQSYMKEIVYLESRSKSNLLYELLTGNWMRNKEDLIERSFGLDIDLSKNYLILVSEFKYSDLIIENTKIKDILYLESIEKKLNLNFPENNDIITSFTNEYFVIMIPINKNIILNNNCEVQYKIAKKALKIIQSQIEGRIILGIGGVSNNWQDIHKKFDNAIFALNMAKTTKERQAIVNFTNYIVEYNLSLIPKHIRTEYVADILGELGINKNSYEEELINSLKRYFYFDMSIKATSEDLFIHRNTLMARLNKVQEITGYRAQTFKDAFRIKVALIMMDLDKIDEL